MITRLELENFKAFAGRHSVDLAPLTLIYGGNSAGKSSLIQSLLLLKQTFESSDPDQPALVVRGNLVDLGSVPGLLHEHDTSYELGFGVDISRPTSARARILPPGVLRYASSFVWDEDARTVRQTAVEIGMGGQTVASYTRRRGPHMLRPVSPTPRSQRDLPFRLGRKEARERFVNWTVGALLRGEARRRRQPWMEELEANRASVVAELVDDVTFAATSFGIVPVYPEFLGKGGKRLFPPPSPRPDEGLIERVIREFYYLWSDLSYAYRFELLENFESLVYLGPLRRPPQRFHQLSGARRTGVGREGEFTAELLSRRRDLVDDVNEWLKRLEIPYSVDAVPISDIKVRHSMGDVIVLILTDLRNGLEVSPGDVGFGISQLLPIVVQTLSGSENVICVEQPEIHVHPRLQAHIADLLVEGVSDRRRNQFIIETHSEHLMLRLQKRVREGTFAARDVSVLYVDVDATGNSYLVPIALESDGSFSRSWPQGFFEERFTELFT